MSESGLGSGSVSKKSDEEELRKPTEEDQPSNLHIQTQKVEEANEDLRSDEETGEDVRNWYELRLKGNSSGKLPDRRGHHSSFIFEGKVNNSHNFSFLSLEGTTSKKVQWTLYGC